MSVQGIISHSPRTSEEVMQSLVDRHLVALAIGDSSVEVQVAAPQGEVEAGAYSQHNHPSETNAIYITYGASDEDGTGVSIKCVSHSCCPQKLTSDCMFTKKN